MSGPESEDPLSPGVQKQIDQRCDDFEKAWLDGESPKMEDFLDGFPAAARPHLLRALLIVEIEYRREEDGGPLSEDQLKDEHVGISEELESAFYELRALGTKRVGVNERTVRLPVPQADPFQTMQAPSKLPGESREGSRGLHIRCPHCSNQVQLVTDTPYEEVCCSTCGSMFSLVERAESSELAKPLKTISRFDLVSRLGVGGFGTVWKARDKDLDRIVAVKIPRRGQLMPLEVEQFFREARTAAQLRHPNIVPVHEVGRESDTLFIVSDFVRGVDLSEWLKAGSPSPWEVAELMVPVAKALDHAHLQGVIHRDLKPSNIMIDVSGQPHLMDFGLAKREVGEITMTVDGQILGTPVYMSPEQAAGEGHWTDRRSDIYSMGVILFEMLTGEWPFRGNAQRQIQQRLTEDAPDPRKLNRHIPADMATICMKCLEREPGRRYATAMELADELMRFLRGEPILARPVSAPARVIRWAKRKPLLATLAALILFLAVAGPATALVIEGQRSRLAELVTEKNNLIHRYADEKGQDTNKIDDLTGQLAVWEGETNPWELWPPKADEPPRQHVLRVLLDHASTTFLKDLESADGVGEDQVRGYLGLAIIADTIHRTPQAIDYYERARDGLLRLSEQYPQRADYARALAECYSALARLVLDTDPAAAKDYLQRANEINRQLAADHPDVVPYQVAWMESELYCATMAGFQAGQQHLAQAATISRALPASWPTDPDDLYRLACHLARREPALEPPTAAAP